ncbi:MAG: PASTA domain-containing protein [Clostridia bacterium]|nr:PASTA domain-containing protein [Clostridia bacterium]
MSDFDNICMNCMHEFENKFECEHCGFDNSTVQDSPFLPFRTIVSQRYLIGSVKEFNGDGVTYSALDIHSKSIVEVREFLPASICTRDKFSNDLIVNDGKSSLFFDYKLKFLNLWKKLARLRGLSNFILVYDIVEENNSVYAVFENSDEYITLREYLSQTEKGYLDWAQTRKLFMPALTTLETLHKAGIIHTGISPSTLLVTKSGKLLFSGFSISPARTARTELDHELFDGYSAIEQYGFSEKQGPWTDIYAFAAVLYRTLTGITPMEATARVTNDKMMIPGEFAEIIPSHVISAIINAMQILPDDRIQDVEDFRSKLSAAPSSSIAMTATISPITQKMEDMISKSSKNTKNDSDKSKNPKKQNKNIIAIVLSFLSIILIIVLITIFSLFVTNRIINTPSRTEKPIDSSAPSKIMVEVPNVVGVSFYTVKAERTLSDFKVDIKYENSSESPKGQIIKQSIDPGKSVPKNSDILITISSGPEQVKMPNVVGKDYEDAKTQLEDLGFEVRKIEKTNFENKPPNTVAEQSIVADGTRDKGSSVTLIVWGEIANMPTTEAETTTTAP